MANMRLLSVPQLQERAEGQADSESPRLTFGRAYEGALSLKTAQDQGKQDAGRQLRALRWGQRLRHLSIKALAECSIIHEAKSLEVQAKFTELFRVRSGRSRGTGWGVKTHR